MADEQRIEDVLTLLHSAANELFDAMMYLQRNFTDESKLIAELDRNWKELADTADALRCRHAPEVSSAKGP